MEMKPLHCCLLLVVVCILFLSVTLLEGDGQTNYEPQKYCSPEEGNIVDGFETDPQGKIRIAKEITLLDAKEYLKNLKIYNRDPQEQTLNKIRKNRGPMFIKTRNMNNRYYTAEDSNPVAVGKSLTCKQVNNQIYPCNTFLGLNEDGSYSRCTDGPDIKTEQNGQRMYNFGKCQKGTDDSKCSMRKYLRIDGDGYNLKQLTVPDVESLRRCDSKYKNQEGGLRDSTGGMRYDYDVKDSVRGRTGRSRIVSLQRVPNQTIKAHLNNNSEENPCGKLQGWIGDMRATDYAYTICGQGWIYNDQGYVCPPGNCVDTTDGGEANVCEEPLKITESEIYDSQAQACGNAVAYLCRDECYYIKNKVDKDHEGDEQTKPECIRCIQDNSHTLIKNGLCSLPKESITTSKDIETKPDIIYTQYQGYKNNEGRRDLYK